MIIDIEKTILLKTKGKFIALVILIIVICVLLFIPFRIDLIKGLDNTLLAIFFAVAYILYTFYESFRNYNYIYYNDNTDKIVLRYFSTGVFTKTKNSIEIPKKEFAGYKLMSFLIRYRENIVLFRRTSKGIAKYPVVSLTALNHDQRSALLAALDRLQLENEKK